MVVAEDLDDCIQVVVSFSGVIRRGLHHGRVLGTCIYIGGFNAPETPSSLGASTQIVKTHMR